MTNRRHFVTSLAAMGAASLLPLQANWAQDAAPFGLPILPTERFRRFTMGDVEIIALHDGATRLPLHDKYVTNAPFAEVKALATSLGLTTDYVELPFTGFLVVSGSRRILLDTGLGDMGTPRQTTGKLVESLRAAGLKPEDIDTVVITHFHPDHVSGLRNLAGEFTYPNATVWVASREYEFWMSDEKMRAAPAQKFNFERAQRVFKGMPEKMLRRYTPGGEVVPGVFSIPAYGHTPGHTIFEVRGGGHTFHYIGDMVNVPAIFLRHPEWSVASDMDADAARAVRLQVLAKVASSDGLIGGFHFPFPAIGRLRSRGGGYDLEPLS
ncbi:MBL fold metallo-hydrolase [Roseateles cellulosilyticus]|uniref:MBL fold metallo-hydrolase n=1 Tax=Pelomonas cellulosilytica TaxID=2906762 RepID=A0ABS8Y185_9BURK|nr:MBL fold metallo-hydrolase [Pelomonas sp. P8]MCE4557977.1 MBL fold metallo-hydrolase [Pelomonas sp. P8]